MKISPSLEESGFVLSNCLDPIKSRHRIDYSSKLKALLADAAFGHFKIIVGDKVIPANKLSLAAKSDYFKRMFSSGFKETSSNQITFNMFSAPTIELIVDYCCTGEIELTEANIGEMEEAASMLLIESLQELCRFWRLRQELINCKLSRDELKVDLSNKREKILAENERFSSEIEALGLDLYEFHHQMNRFKVQIPAKLKNMGEQSKLQELDSKVGAIIDDLRRMILNPQ